MLFYFVEDGNLWLLPEYTSKMVWLKFRIFEFQSQMQLD